MQKTNIHIKWKIAEKFKNWQNYFLLKTFIFSSLIIPSEPNASSTMLVPKTSHRESGEEINFLRFTKMKLF